MTCKNVPVKAEPIIKLAFERKGVTPLKFKDFQERIPDLVCQTSVGGAVEPKTFPLSEAVVPLGDGLYVKWGKRCFDIVLALVLLVVTAPILLLVAAGVKLSSSGPILFIHQRVGKDGKLFNFLKFRSMYTDLEDSSVSKLADNMARKGLLLKVDNDPRITPLGRIIRKTSIDELPQLFNVLRGEMSFVGPRPLVEFMVRDFAVENRIRSRVRPGITGNWQVYARSDCMGLHQMLDHDVRYVREVSIWTDLKLLLLTIPAVLSCRGAR
jgi:exopolysaccharide production protein ExoY